MQFWTIALKDLKILRRDRSALIFTFGMPIILTFVFGSMFGGSSGTGGVPEFKVLVANQDLGPRGGEVMQSMSSAGLKPEAENVGPAQMEQMIGKGDFAVGVVIPPDFSRVFDAAISDPSAPRAAIKLVADPGNKRISVMIKGMIGAAAERMVVTNVVRQYSVAAMALANRTSVDLNVLNEKSNSLTPGDEFLPGFMVYFVFTLANGVASTLLGERQEGTLRRMLNAPVSRFEILIGKLMARSVLGVLQTGMLIAIGVGWLHLSVAQAPIGILLTALTTIFAACGLGLLMATFGKTMDQIQGMTTMFLLLLGFVSGTLIPREFLPKWMVRMSYVTPHAWALNAYQDLIQRHHTLVSTLPNLAVVAIFGVVFFSIALARFKFE
jgi:ABC-2 type transport system permease protein